MVQQEPKPQTLARAVQGRTKSPHTANMVVARTVPLLLLLQLLTFSLHHTTAHFTPIECCFRYAQKPIQDMQSFYETPRDCSLPAVVIVAASDVKICADPKKRWVKNAMKKLPREK